MRERRVRRVLRVQGFLQTALVVSSFHVLDTTANDGVAERVVRILYGEGDRYGCWLDVAADAIVWHALKGGEGAEAAQQGARGAAAAADEQQVTLGALACWSEHTHVGWWCIGAL